MGGNIKKDILVLGVGNVLLADEGIGVHIIKEMATLSLPAEVELMDGGTAALDLIPHLEERKKIIFIDCLDADAPPGTMYRLTCADLEEIKPFTQSSLHQVGLVDTIKLSRLQGNEAQMVVIGITPKNFREYRIGISPELEAVVPRVIETVMKEINTC